MSDPVSNADIEDVLSSIRRLISAGQSDQNDGGDSEAPVDNKLILTPAFRVFEGDRADTSDADQDADASQFSTGRDIPVEKLEQEPATDVAPETLAESEDVVDVAEVPEMEDTLGLSPIDLPLEVDTVESGLQSGADMPLPAADSQVDFEDNWDSAALGETAQVAFLHERLNRAAEEAEQDAEASEPLAESEHEAEPIAAEVVEPASTPETADELSTEATELAATEETVEDSPAQLDTAPMLTDTDQDSTAPADEEITPDLGAASVEDLATDVAADELIVDAVNEDAEPTVPSVDVEDVPMAEIVDDDADFIDEAHLQEIVSRIVREELKGEIGVKITQAVRRMVRREVTRALSLEKFED